MDEKRKMLHDAQQEYINWFAAGDTLIVDTETGRLTKRKKLTQLAAELGYTRQTLYNWQRDIPDFNERVDKAQHALILARNNAVWNSLFIKAAGGDLRAIVTYLTNFDKKFKNPYNRLNSGFTPQMIAEKNADGYLLDLLELARKRSAEAEAGEQDI
jgi:hypothetical protein